MAALGQNRRIGDLVRMEQPQNYCREIVQLTQGAGQITVIGTPLIVTAAAGTDTAVVVTNPNEANCNALALQVANAVAPNPAVNILVLRRGPAIVSQNEVETLAGGVVMTTVYDALKNNSHILTEPEPATIAVPENATDFTPPI